MVAIALFGRKYSLPMPSVGDAAALVAPFGLCLGRVAHFIKPDLWGRLGDAARAQGASVQASHADLPGARPSAQASLAPAYFSLSPKSTERSEAAVQFLAFLRTIRNYRGEAICIDMSRVQRMIVNATLLFKAEVAYLRQRGVKVGCHA